MKKIESLKDSIRVLIYDEQGEDICSFLVDKAND